MRDIHLLQSTVDMNTSIDELREGLYLGYYVLVVVRVVGDVPIFWSCNYNLQEKSNLTQVDRH